MQTAHLVSVRTSEENLLTLSKRQNTIVLQQYLRLFSSLQRSLGKLVAAELLEALTTCVRFLKESETILRTENTTNGVVDTIHRYLTLVHQFLQQNAELHAVGIH